MSNLIVLTLVLLALSGVSLFVGVSQFSLADIIAADPLAMELFWQSRIPRLTAILLAGACLSIAGLIMQQISQNRFASPSTSGTIESAMLGFVISLVLFGDGDHWLIIFATALLGTLLFMTVIARIRFKNAVFIPLVGIIYGNIISSLATFIAYRFDALQNLQSWAVANFANLLQGDFELLYLAIPLGLFSYAYAVRIAAVGLGKDFAVNLGMNYAQVVFVGIVLVSVSAACVVMIVGELPFLGLIVPNLVRYFCGDNLRKNIPITALSGALLVLACDLVSRLVIFPYEVPISMVISILGGAVFFVLIVKGHLHER